MLCKTIPASNLFSVSHVKKDWTRSIQFIWNGVYIKEFLIFLCVFTAVFFFKFSFDRYLLYKYLRIRVSTQ